MIDGADGVISTEIQEKCLNLMMKKNELGACSRVGEKSVMFDVARDPKNRGAFLLYAFNDSHQNHTLGMRVRVLPQRTKPHS